MKDNKPLWAVVASATDQLGTRYSEALASNDLNLLLIDTDKSLLQTNANRLYKEYNVGVEIICLDPEKNLEEVMLENRLKDMQIGVFVPDSKNKKIDEILHCEINNKGEKLEVIKTGAKDIYVTRHLAERLDKDHKFIH